MLPFPLENNYFLSHETLYGVVLLGHPIALLSAPEACWPGTPRT